MSCFAAAGLVQSLELLSAAREVADSIPEPGQYSGEEGTSFAVQTARPSRYSHVQIETAVNLQARGVKTVPLFTYLLTACLMQICLKISKYIQRVQQSFFP